MARQYGYWVELDSAMKFSDDGEGSWIQAFPEGTYNHPLYGELKFDEKKLKDFVQSVKDRVRGVQPDIDYDHKMFSGEAAGWVHDAEYRPGEGLHLNVKWTPKAREAIANGSYKYFSPEFVDEWEHPKTKKVHSNVLAGGALTNRPFLKDILPVNLSELAGQSDPTNVPDPTTGGLMDPKELRKALGLAEDAPDADVNAKLTTLKQLHEAMNAPTPPVPTPPVPTPPVPTPPAPTDPKLSEKTIPELLAELNSAGIGADNPAMAMLNEMLAARDVTIQNQATQLREIQVDSKLSELDKGKKFAVPPAVKEKLRAIMLGVNKELGEQVFDAYKKTIDLGVVDLNEHGWQKKGEGTVSPTQALNAEIRKLQEADKELRYQDAYIEVCKMRPDLASAVRQDSYIKDGV